MIQLKKKIPTFLSFSLAAAASICSSQAQAQSTSGVLQTPWEMIRTDVIDAKPPYATTHGDPKNYAYAKLPSLTDKGWQLAPVNEKGQLHFEELSRLTQGEDYKKLDFTYFRSFVYVPEDLETIKEFRVTISDVDDGARMYLVNDAHMDGVHSANEDAKLLGTNVTADFTADAQPGMNLLIIIQFDDAWKHNRLINGVEVEVNGMMAKTASMEHILEGGSGSGGSGKAVAGGSGSTGNSGPGGSGNNPNNGGGGTGSGVSGKAVAGGSGSAGNSGRGGPGNNPNNGGGIGSGGSGEAVAGGSGSTGNSGPGGSGNNPNNGGGGTGSGGSGKAVAGGSGSTGNRARFSTKELMFFPKKFTMETYGVDGKGRRGPESRYFIGWKSSGKSGIITKADDGKNGAYIFEIDKETVPGGVALKVANFRGGKAGQSYYLPNLQPEKHVYKIKEPLWNKRDLTVDNEYNFRSLDPVTSPGKFLRHSNYKLYNQGPTKKEVDEDKSRRVYQQDATWHFHPIQEISTELAGSATKSGREYTLTANESDQSGAVWTSAEIDFTRDFEIKAEIYLGDDDEGADGMALVFQDEGNHMVGKGGELGYKSIAPSFIVEFDTYQNRDDFKDPVKDHVGLRSDGSPVHDNDYVEVENLEDGKYHPISFDWNSKSQRFDFKMDGKVIFKNQKFPKSAFKGSKTYFGFTAATGLYKNLHKVKSITFSN